MAHGIKKILIDKKEELECNNNQTNITKMALNHLLLDNCCHNPANQNLINQKNSSTNTNALVGATAATAHHSLPPTQSTTLMNNSNGNKLTLNCSGASMSTITSSSVTTTATKSPTTGTKMGSRRIFTPQFKLQVLESYRNDNDCKGNQRATARKYGIHRRQIQKWLQCENNLRSIIANNPQNNVRNNAIKSIGKATAPILSSSTSSRHRGVIVSANTDKNGATYSCFTLANVKSYKSNSVGSSTKSLSSSSSSSSSMPFAVGGVGSCSGGDYATAIENHKNLPDFYHINSIYNNSDDLPIDLSSSAGGHLGTKIKSEFLARPIPLHPTSSCYKIPFYANFTPQQQQQQHQQQSTTISPPSTSSSPHQLIDISNSVVKSESNTIDPIDLSISNVSHKRKHSTDNVNCKDDDNKKPIKLFRPYLESNFDNDEINHVKQEEIEQQSNTSDAQKFPIIWSNAYTFYPDHHGSFHHQSSNHPFLMSASPTSYYDSHHLAIPITPSSMSTISSPNDSGIINTSYHQTLLPPSQASPVSGYDSSTSSMYSFNDNEVDLSRGNSPPYTSSHYDASSPPFSSATMSPTVETKVPLSSSSSSFLHDLKFKLHALDCYYNDAECKRNEKLVANKLNINCKVVEKWLRQESDLRNQQKQYHLQILV